MRRAITILQESEQIGTIEDLTGVFESIASTRIAKIKTKVDLSKEFFALLWQRYSVLRIDPHQSLLANNPDAIDKNVFVIISAEAGLSGDIDDRLLEKMLEDYQPDKTDLIVLGSHGANQLKQRHIPFVHYFQVPESEEYVDVSPVIHAIKNYAGVTVYYEDYLSLGVQEIKKIDLISSVKAMSQEVDLEAQSVTEDTLFEPSLEEIAGQMELTMISLAFSQVILESSLAQDASRFNAMAVAKKRAHEMTSDYRMEYYRAKRHESDRRQQEVMVSIKKKRRGKKL